MDIFNLYLIFDSCVFGFESNSLQMQVNLITLFNFCFGVNHNPEVALRISSDVYNT